MNSPYHAFLLRNRRYCEHDGCLMKLERATKVVNRNGKDYVYCDFHGYQPRGPIEQGLRKRYQMMMEDR